MVTRLEILQSLYSCYVGHPVYNKIIARNLKEDESSFIAEYQKLTGHKLTRVIKNHYFINR